MHLAEGENDTVGRVLAQIGIDPAEVSHVFLNGRLVPRSGYPILLGYPLAADEPLLQDAYLDRGGDAGRPRGRLSAQHEFGCGDSNEEGE